MLQYCIDSLSLRLVKLLTSTDREMSFVVIFSPSKDAGPRSNTETDLSIIRLVNMILLVVVGSENNQYYVVTTVVRNVKL